MYLFRTKQVAWKMKIILRAVLGQRSIRMICLSLEYNRFVCKFVLAATKVPISTIFKGFSFIFLPLKDSKVTLTEKK